MVWFNQVALSYFENFHQKHSVLRWKPSSINLLFESSNDKGERECLQVHLSTTSSCLLSRAAICHRRWQQHPLPKTSTTRKKKQKNNNPVVSIPQAIFKHFNFLLTPYSSSSHLSNYVKRLPFYLPSNSGVGEILNH